MRRLSDNWYSRHRHLGRNLDCSGRNPGTPGQTTELRALVPHLTASLQGNSLSTRRNSRLSSAQLRHATRTNLTEPRPSKTRCGLRNIKIWEIPRFHASSIRKYVALVIARTSPSFARGCSPRECTSLPDTATVRSHVPREGGDRNGQNERRPTVVCSCATSAAVALRLRYFAHGEPGGRTKCSRATAHACPALVQISLACPLVTCWESGKKVGDLVCCRRGGCSLHML